VGRRDQYRAQLRALAAPAWPAYLSRHSGLPGPRGNIELAQAVADEGDPRQFAELIATGDEYLGFCGVLGLGPLLAQGEAVAKRLRQHATDPRWRLREAVAMALQRLGDADLPRLLALAEDWAQDPDPLVARAAVAGLCEPRLLKTATAATTAVNICELLTTRLAGWPSQQRRTPGVKALRQALGYCWSVAVAADPPNGLARFDALTGQADQDVAWIVRTNRTKARLARLLDN
jgi:hypothetical protein